MPELPSVFRFDGARYLPGELARGPWQSDAQHGGAPAALLAMLAEEAVADSGLSLARFTMELPRPVPLKPLTPRVTVAGGRTAKRVRVELADGDTVCAQAVALMVKAQPLDIQVGASDCPLTSPEDCHTPVRIPGMAEVTSFHYTAVEARQAGGDTASPGPAAAWFRFRAAIIEGRETTPAARALGASDFGNGLSWAVPLDQYLFANLDLTAHLLRAPRGEWIGLDSETQVEATGIGVTGSRLFDGEGLIGFARQTLLVRKR